MSDKQKLREQIRTIYRSLLAFLGVFGIIGVALLVYIKYPGVFSSTTKTTTEVPAYTAIPEDEDFDKIVDGIHVKTGFIEAEGLMETVRNCTNCHSSELVLQNRMSKERWVATIRWMQETQNLWDLGGNEEIIVNYLVTNYPVIAKGRRAPLTEIQWYDLED